MNVGIAQFRFFGKGLPLAYGRIAVGGGGGGRNASFGGGYPRGEGGYESLERVRFPQLISIVNNINPKDCITERGGE